MVAQPRRASAGLRACSLVSVAHRQLRTRLAGLVYRDVAATYQQAVLLVALLLAYLFTAWPPDQIRTALRTSTPERAATILALVMLVHHLASAPLVDRMLAAPRLQWWLHLPVTRGFWRSLRVRHLLGLHAAWIAASVYAMLPGLVTQPLRELAYGLAWLGFSLAAAPARVLLRDRAWPLRSSVALASALGVLLTWRVSPFAGALLGNLALLFVLARLDRPLPERAAPRRMPWSRARWGPAALALVRLFATLLVRGEPVRSASTLAFALGLGLVANLAHAQVGEAGHGLVRGAAIVACSCGAIVLERVDRLLVHDRGLLDAWGLPRRAELLARILFTLLAALPFVLVAAARVPLAWTLEHACVLAWACVGGLRAAALAQTRIARDPALGRFLLRVLAAIVVVVIARSTLPLLAWMLLEALRLPPLLARADAARRRVAGETPKERDAQ